MQVSLCIVIYLRRTDALIPQASYEPCLVQHVLVLHLQVQGDHATKRQQLVRNLSDVEPPVPRPLPGYTIALTGEGVTDPMVVGTAGSTFTDHDSFVG